MKKWLLIFLLLPLMVVAQKKSKKEKLAEAKARQELVANLKKHIQYLADDKLES